MFGSSLRLFDGEIRRWGILIRLDFSVAALIALATVCYAPPRMSCSSTVGGFAPPLADTAFQEHLEKLVKDFELPGAVAAVIKGGELRQRASAGIRKWKTDAPFEFSDTIHLGSCTKAVTATAAAILVEEDLLSWESCLVEVVPELQEKIHDGYSSVTLRQLLQHRAGVPANANDWWLNEGQGDFETRLAIAVDSLRQAPKKSGEFRYSNLGYMLAGLMLTRASGQSWEQLIRDRIFEPLRMESAGFGPPGTQGRIDQPWGHRKVGKFVLAFQRDNSPALGPAGTIHCNMADWSKFIRVHLGDRVFGQRLVKPATLRLMHRPPKDSNYAMGWLVSLRGGEPVKLNHSGSNTMWYSVATLDLRRNRAILFSSNIGPEVAKPASDKLLKFAEGR